MLQGVLKPLHDILIFCLRSIKTDATYHQEKIFAWSDRMRVMGKPIYSLDLSRATDRLPVDLQEEVLCLILEDPKLSAAWSGIIKSISFLWRTGGSKDTVISYAVGQGMGLYSS